MVFVCSWILLDDHLWNQELDICRKIYLVVKKSLRELNLSFKLDGGMWYKKVWVQRRETNQDARAN